MKLLLSRLHATANMRFPDDEDARKEYLADHMAVADLDGEHYVISATNFEKLKVKYGPRPQLPPGAPDDKDTEKRISTDDIRAFGRNHESKKERHGSLIHKARAALKGAKSIAKTSVGIDVAADKLITSRLKVCEYCPGNFAIWHTKEGIQVQPQTKEERDKIREDGGKVHTCGPLLAKQEKEEGSSCGCVLNNKAIDVKEHCPNEWWPGESRNGEVGLGN